MAGVVILYAGLFGAVLGGHNARSNEIARTRLVRMCRRTSPSRQHHDTATLERVDDQLLQQTTLRGTITGAGLAMCSAYLLFSGAAWLAKRRAGMRYRFWRVNDTQ